MRCYFIADGHIVGVEMLTVRSDEEALEAALLAFAKRTDPLDGFEVWDRDRMVVSHPPAPAGVNGQSAPKGVVSKA